VTPWGSYAHGVTPWATVPGGDSARGSTLRPHRGPTLAVVRSAPPAAALAAVLLLAACSAGPTQSHEQTGGGRAASEVAPGVMHRSFTAPGVPPFTGHLFDIDLARADVRLVVAPGNATGGARDVVGQLAAGYGRHVATNASFFGPDGRALGRVVAGGTVVSAGRAGSWGALVVRGGRAQVLAPGRLPRSGPVADVVVQGVPRLVVDGKVPALKQQTAARTAVCGEGTRLVLVVTTMARTRDFAAFLARPVAAGGAGCTQALNLDGGGSSQLDARLGDLRVSMPGAWGVPNALVAVPRP